MLTSKRPDATIEHNYTTKSDVRVVLTINGLKIGIESGSRLVKESLNLFVTMGCEVIICATRTSGATVDAVNALQGFAAHWLEQREQSQPNEQILRSLVMARNIVEKVEVLIETPAPLPARSFSATA